jgi:hypothetical protein
MAEIPTLNDDSPVLNTVKINSTAEGYEAFAKTLGQLATTATDTATEIEKDQSQTMYINSVANVEQLKTTARMRMLEHPDQAPKIADQNDDALDIIKKNAFVNNKDRARLNAYISGASDDVALEATKTEVEQRQLEAATTHYTNWPDQLKAYAQANITDHEQAEHLKEAMIASLHGLVMSRAITPYQMASGLKDMDAAVDAARDTYEVYGNPDSTAKDYHTVAANPLNEGQDKTAAPINESTKWLTDYHNNDLSFQSVRSDIYNRQLPNPLAFSRLEPAQRKQAIQEIHGVQAADGLINSGEPFPAIEHLYNTLDRKGEVLNYRDDALKHALGGYINKLKNGNYLDVMAQTPQGDAIMKKFVMQNTAIKNSSISNEQKNQQILQNKNDLVNNSVSYAEGHHIPNQYVQPIPQNDVSIVENSFIKGNDPKNALTIMGQYTKQNKTYVANALKNPDQRIVMQALAFAPPTIKPQDQLDFIAANQTGEDKQGQPNDKGRTYELDHDKRIHDAKVKIAANLDTQMRFISQNYDPESAQILQNSMINTATNYVKYQAQKDNNILSTGSWSPYIDKATQMYSQSFAPMTGLNYSINPQQLPMPMSKGQLDVVSNYVVGEGYKKLKTGRSDTEYMAATDRNPLRMILSPTNQFQAVDGNGQVYFSTPISERLVPYAQKVQKEHLEAVKKSNQPLIEKAKAREEAYANAP